jgi:hypothetical protein
VAAVSAATVRDLDDFVNCYLGRDGSPQPSAGDSVNRPYLSRHERKESERFKGFSYEELTKRDKLNSTSSGSKTKAWKTARTFHHRMLSRRKS